MAIETGSDVQSVDYAALRKRSLDASDQILDPRPPPAAAPKPWTGIVIDDRRRP